MLYESASSQKRDALFVGAAVEWHRQVQRRRVHADGSAGDRHALGVARELEFRGGGTQLLERQVPITQDVDLTMLDTPMHPARHLQDLIGAQIGSREDILAPLHDVSVPGVVD